MRMIPNLQLGALTSSLLIERSVSQRDDISRVKIAGSDSEAQEL
jgi:hypothetical protein